LLLFFRKEDFFLNPLMPPLPRWADTPPQILFDDAHMRVLFCPGGSDWLLITFGDALTLADGTRFYAQAIVEKQGLNCLGFMAKEANWYPRASMIAAMPEIAYTLGAFGTRLLHGSSMGGYAAIKYSRLLGATHVVAYSPQWSIDPAECGANSSGYEASFRPAMRGMGVRRRDAGGSINVFYDPWQAIDAWHFRMISAVCGGVRGYRVPYAEHHVAEVLKGSQTAAAIWQACRRGDVARVYRSLNAARRKSGFRRQYLLLHLARTRPFWASRLIAALRARHQLDLPHPPAVLAPLFRALLRQGGAGAALRLLEAAPAYLEGSRRETVLRQLRSGDVMNWRQGFLTAHGTRLVYCVLEGRLMHVAAPADAAAAIGLFGVFDAARLGCPGLTINAGGILLACAVDEDGRFRLVPADECAAHDMIRADMPGGPDIALRNRGFYLCAEPDGTLRCDRIYAGPWEIFRHADGPQRHLP